MMAPKSENERPVAPGPPANKVSPLNSQPWPGRWKHTAPRECPGVCKTVRPAPATVIVCPSERSRSGARSG